MFESLHFKRRSTETDSSDDTCDNCCGSNV